MATGYFGKDISPACQYCENGKTTNDGRMVLCSRIGIVYKEYACKRFVYAPLKREPKRRNPLGGMSEADFKL